MLGDQENLERGVLLVATLTSFMGPFLISSVNVALPAIQSELGLNAIELSWIATAYLLAMAVGLVPAGKVADIYGRKRVFATGIGVYTLGAALSMFADSGLLLIGSRVVQGIGGAMFVTTGMAIITSVFPPKKRGRAIGIYVAAVYIGLSMGPSVGGVITQQLGWRAIFLLTLFMGILCLVVTLKTLTSEWKGEPGQRLDLVGCLLYGVSIVCLVYGASRLPGMLGGLLAGSGILLMILFFYHQRRANYPVFQVELFAENRNFAFSSLAALLNYSATFAVTFLISLYLQYIKAMSPQEAGVLLMAQPVMMAVFSPFAGRWADRIDPRYLATAGMVITVVGVLFFLGLDENTRPVYIVANLVLLGLGFGLFSSPNMSAIMGAVEKHQYGVASGAVSTMRLLGQMASMAIAMVVLSLLVGRQTINTATYGPFLKAIHIIFLISAVLCTVGVYFSWFRGDKDLTD